MVTAPRRTADAPYDSLIVAAGAATPTSATTTGRRRARDEDDRRRARDPRRACSARSRSPSGARPAERARGSPSWSSAAARPASSWPGRARGSSCTALRGAFRSFRYRGSAHRAADGGPRCCPASRSGWQRKAQAELERMGVEVHLPDVSPSVVDANGDPAARHRHGESRLHAHNVIWAAGVTASPLAGVLAAPPAPGRPGGRVACCPTSPCPVTRRCSRSATWRRRRRSRRRAGRDAGGAVAADAIDQRLAGQPAPKPFRYRDKESSPTLRRSAVASSGRLRLAGGPALGRAGRLSLAFWWASRTASNHAPLAAGIRCRRRSERGSAPPACRHTAVPPGAPRPVAVDADHALRAAPVRDGPRPEDHVSTRFWKPTRYAMWTTTQTSRDAGPQASRPISPRPRCGRWSAMLPMSR